MQHKPVADDATWTAPHVAPRGSVAQTSRTWRARRQTQRHIDQEVVRLLRDAEDAATKLLDEHREQLDELVVRLLDQETVDGSEVYQLVGRSVPGVADLGL